MRILILNWRDIKNPTSGGAEVLTQELAKQLVKQGHTVTQFSSYFPGAQKREVIDGVKIERDGNPDTRYLTRSVHFLAFWNYKKKWQNKFDVVVDEVHGIPFFTPLYVKEKKVVLICEVADELWMKMFIPIFGLIGRLIEKFYLRFLYKNILFLTISESTKHELIKNGVLEKHIIVLPMGIRQPKELRIFKKEKEPTLILVARVSAIKGAQDAIETIREVIKFNKNAKLWIVGRGNKGYIEILKKYCIDVGVSKNVIFYNFVDEEKKYELMSKAHIIISPSQKEGFGLTIKEAAFVGTPSVVYNAPGLREIVDDGVTGIICLKNTPQNLAINVIKILKNKIFYDNLCRNAKEESKNYRWEKTAKVFLETVHA